METKINIEFEPNKMIIRHPSGHVDEYDKKHLIKLKEYWVGMREEIEKKIKAIEENIAKL